MADVLLTEGVSFTGVVRKLKVTGISLSMFFNKMPLIESFLSSYIVKHACIDNYFTIATQINRNFTAAVKCTSEFVIKSSDTEILFQ